MTEAIMSLVYSFGSVIELKREKHLACLFGE